MGKVFSRFCAYILYIFQFEIVPHLYYIWDSCTQTLLLFLVFILLRTFIYIFNETNCVMCLILKFYGISTVFISLIKKKRQNHSRLHVVLSGNLLEDLFGQFKTYKFMSRFDSAPYHPSLCLNVYKSWKKIDF